MPLASVLTSMVPTLAQVGYAEELLDVFEPLLALLQLLRAERHHKEGVSQAASHHKESMDQAKEMHDVELRQATELTQKELNEANKLHREAIHQALTQHEREVRLTKEIYQREHDLTNYLHDLSMWAQSRLHTDNKKYTLQLFSKELAHAQNISRKENIRDHLVQESQRAQAIMIVDTLMFGCCFGIIIEGQLPASTDSALVVAFSSCLALSLSFLIVSVWFAMNLQSRITKFKIADPNVRYGLKQHHFSSFSKYYDHYCKPVYRLTHIFMWIGTVMLLITGVILIGCRLALDHKNHRAASVFALSLAVCILVLAGLLFAFNPKLERTRAREDEDDYKDYENFIRDMRRQLLSHDQECPDCRLPMDVFHFCPSTGQAHTVVNVEYCDECHFQTNRFQFCPVSGKAHPEPPGGWETALKRKASNSNPTEGRIHLGGANTAMRNNIFAQILRHTPTDLENPEQELDTDHAISHDLKTHFPLPPPSLESKPLDIADRDRPSPLLHT
eukprot:Sspe_Gene.40520::Locus_19582_Transcript_1_1_Confidence_1.000_Length_1556::g.40520::m.40520